METTIRALAIAAIATFAFAHIHTATAEEAIPPAGHLGPKDVKRATSLVKDGKVYSLAVVTGPKTPAYEGRFFSMHVKPIFEHDKRIIGSNKIEGFEDMVCTYLGIGTQIDGLGHVGINGRHFGGAMANDIWRPDGLKRFSVDTIKPIVTRGVLVDMVALKGKSLAPGEAVSTEGIKGALKRQHTKIHKGDVVLIHTGWEAVADSNPKQFLATEPGITKDAAEYLAERGAVAVGADNWGLEVVPAENSTEIFPVHQILLASHGIYVLENIQTLELAADHVYEFLFVLAAPRFKGAVQGIVHPVAIR